MISVTFSLLELNPWKTRKTPKLLAAFPIIVLASSAIIAWSAYTRVETTSAAKQNMLAESESGEPLRSPGSTDQEIVARMDARMNLIASRLAMAAPIEKGSINEERLIARNLADGTIVEVSLEEVESISNAAAKTPEIEDDIAADRLKHCGSYRFFLPD